MPARVRYPDISRQTPSRNGEIRALAARQRDLVTRDQLSSLGLGPAAVARRVADGSLRRVFRAVYTVAQAPLSREAMWLAAVLACGEGAAISHFAAGLHLGVSRFRTARIDVLAPRKRTLDGVRVHYCRTLPLDDVTTVRGLPVTRFKRLVVDLADVLTPFQLANVLHQGAGRGLVPPDIPSPLGRHNLATLNKAFALHRAGSAGTRSTAEDVFLRLISDLPEPIVNTVHLGFEVDFRWPEHLLVVEVDGPLHGRAYNRNADDHRDVALVAAGYTVLRFSADDVQSRGGWVRETVLRENLLMLTG
jgi:hypothetical protein